jgi:aldehyde dehydrogenase (NAD+)
VKEEFLHALTNALADFYGVDPQKSSSYARVVNARHFLRLKNILQNTKGKIRIGGAYDESTRYFSPTLVELSDSDDSLMQEELFGPLLPILTINSWDEARRIVRKHSQPLALYLFSDDRKLAEAIIRDIPFGGGCINDTLIHLSVPELPFGGVGPSGMGNYHGKASFDCFTHFKSIFHKSFWPDVALRYPPYSDSQWRWLRKLMMT